MSILSATGTTGFSLKSENCTQNFFMDTFPDVFLSFGIISKYKKKKKCKNFHTTYPRKSFDYMSVYSSW